MQLKPGKNIKLFQNSFLEKCTYVHPLLPIGLWGPFIIYCFYLGKVFYKLSLRDCLLLAASGFFVWTLAEYLLHRFIFHFKPRGAIQSRIAFLIHGIHHEDPGDQRRLLMPPIAAITIATFFYIVFRLILGAAYVLPFFAAFLIGYLCYDYIHFATHFFKPRQAWFLKLRQNHMRHHFVAPEKLYGVSSPLWDYVFGTNH